ncbi:hypothetical protein [Streptomyces sp. KL110A]|uniref:hypothetical protein n=1 Tax=Streptomyces sp. KL110A TaxID=3384221 RepID=UPI0038C71EF9
MCWSAPAAGGVGESKAVRGRPRGPPGRRRQPGEQGPDEPERGAQDAYRGALGELGGPLLGQLGEPDQGEVAPAQQPAGHQGGEQVPEEHRQARQQRVGG